MAQMSFTLSRPGLKEDHYVPIRLRLVDTITLLSGIPVVVLAFGGWLATWIILGPLLHAIVVFVLGLAISLTIIWSLWFLNVALLKGVFRVTRMMTAEESASFPLKAQKEAIDPWPESWQKKINPLD